MTHSTPDRRSLIAGGAALAGAAMLPSAGAAQIGGVSPPKSLGPSLAPAKELRAAVQKFLDGLEPEKRKAATFAWNGPEWRNWNYFGSGDNIKPGLRLEQMDAAQKQAEE